MEQATEEMGGLEAQALVNTTMATLQPELTDITLRIGQFGKMLPGFADSVEAGMRRSPAHGLRETKRVAKWLRKVSKGLRKKTRSAHDQLGVLADACCSVVRWARRQRGPEALSKWEPMVRSLMATMRDVRPRFTLMQTALETLRDRNIERTLNGACQHMIDTIALLLDGMADFEAAVERELGDAERPKRESA